MSTSSNQDVPTIDFAGHLHPSETESNPMNRRIQEVAGAPIHRDHEALLEVYEAAGYDGAVVSQSSYMGHDDLEETREENDLLLDAVESDDRLYGLAAIPTAAGGEAAAGEFERCLENGYHGGALETMSDGIELVDGEVEPILEVADRTGAPVMVHPKLHDSLGAGVLDDAWLLNRIFGREVAMAVSISKVIHEGVFDRYDDLNLVFHHSGGHIGGFMGRIELSLRDDFWPGGERAKPYTEFKRQFEERVYLDSAGHDGYRGTLRATLDEVPASNLLLGTDVPYEIRTPEALSDMVEAIEDVAPDADAAEIRGGNALDLLVNTD